MNTLTKKVLLLNADYIPIRVITWKRAIKMWIKDKVEIIEEYHDEDITSVNFSMKCPAVIRLLYYVNKFHRRKVKFSRQHLYSRDKFTCQYCGISPGIKELTLDHVIPKCLGGKTTWENIVAACKSCNSKKADKTIEKIGYSLKKTPKEPTVAEFMSLDFVVPNYPETWKNYIYWNATIR